MLSYLRRLGAKGRPSMPGIEGGREGCPLVPKWAEGAIE